MKKLLAILVACLMPICLIAGSGISAPLDVNTLFKKIQITMIKIFLLLLLILPSQIVLAQNKSKVTLKNGTEIIGSINYIDPTNYLKISVAGFETTIKMSDVAKIEEINQSSTNAPISSPNKSVSNEKVIVTDFTDYPESFELEVGNQKMKMILVRGGDLQMGYNGSHSVRYKSEPLHLVKVTSFYMSETYVTNAISNYFSGKENKKEYFKNTDWGKCNQLANLIAKSSGIPLRLPTEAEWEYAAFSPVQNILFSKCKEIEHCLDFLDSFDNMDGAIDPTGPSKGNKHVCRTFAYGAYPESCKNDRTGGPILGHTFMRLVVKAKDVKF